MNNLVMAYLGDAVYELFIREYLINKGICKVKDLQNESIKYVSAVSQRRILEELIDYNFLTDEEIEIVNRGRNASSHPSKTTDIITSTNIEGSSNDINYLNSGVSANGFEAQTSDIFEGNNDQFYYL